MPRTTSVPSREGDDPVGESERFLQVMRHEQDRALCLGPDPQELTLQQLLEL